MRVVVLGAGVSGLSCAVRLLEAGHEVDVWTRDAPSDTTSAVAAAVWYPYRAGPQEKIAAWALSSLEAFRGLSEAGAGGVFLSEVLELFREPTPDPWYRELLPGFRRARPADLPPHCRDGWTASSVPVIEMPPYLAWLVARIEEAGGRVVRREARSIEEAATAADVVVNCAGMGARELCDDRALVPVRGQVVVVSQVGLERVVLDEHGPGGLTYIVPRRSDVVLGGTADEGDESLEPMDATARDIFERCAALEPRLRAARILGHKVGLRPGRPAVRLEAERAGDAIVVHNYGHGGSGVTLSWGCADDVVGLVSSA
ncbi:MAG: FAD-dependent oxidoreductase [Actinomycetota bacterium]